MADSHRHRPHTAGSPAPGLGSGAWPLLAPRALDQPLAWRRGEAVSGAQFLRLAHALARRLPDGAAVVNLCQDRLAFAVALAAALLRGCDSLLPPNARVDTLQALGDQSGGVIALVDSGAGVQWPLAHLGVDLTADASAQPQPDGVPLLPAVQPAACLLTSGSTGAPQPHAKTWGMLNVNVRSEARRMADHLRLPSLEGLAIVATVPPQHSYGFESSVLLAMLGGAAFECSRPFYPADIVNALESVPAPRALVTTPFHLKALLTSGLALPPTDLVVSATAPLTPQLARRTEATTRGQLIEIYGCTEAGQVATRRTAVTETWHTFGELRLHARPGDGGEVYVAHGGHVAEPTDLSDILRLADPSHFELLGRANDLIHVAGRRSSLGHLNYHLNSIDGVEDGAFWLPDDVPDGVVRPVAFVVAPRLGAAQIIRALRERLEPVFVPRRVVHVPCLPREATGKLTAQSLRELARSLLGCADA